MKDIFYLMSLAYTQMHPAEDRPTAVGCDDLLSDSPDFDSSAAAFNDHLDACPQCKNHPFALCIEGDKRLRQAAQSGCSGSNINQQQNS